MAQGENRKPAWFPDSRSLAFVSTRERCGLLSGRFHASAEARACCLKTATCRPSHQTARASCSAVPHHPRKASYLGGAARGSLPRRAHDRRRGRPVGSHRPHRGPLMGRKSAIRPSGLWLVPGSGSRQAQKLTHEGQGRQGPYGLLVRRQILSSSALTARTLSRFGGSTLSGGVPRADHARDGSGEPPVAFSRRANG